MGSWGDTMKDAVTVAPIVSRDSYGKPTYGTKVSVKVRYEPDAVAIRNAEGEVVDYADTLITETAIDTSDAVRGGWAETGVWPPGADTTDDGAAIKPSRVMRTTDLDGGDTLYEVTL